METNGRLTYNGSTLYIVTHRVVEYKSDPSRVTNGP